MADLYNFVDINGNVIEENLHATEDTHGLMCPDDKVKLATIEEGANKTIVDEELNETSTNPIQNKAVKAALDENYEDAKAYTDAQVGDIGTILDEINGEVV